MFGFFKRKQKEKAIRLSARDAASDNVAKSAPTDDLMHATPLKAPSVAEAERDVLTEGDLRTLAQLWFSRNNFAAIYYAHCTGLRAKTLSSDNFSEFWTLASSPEDAVTQEGKRFAFQHFADEVWASVTSQHSTNALNEIRQDDAEQTLLRRKLEKIQSQHPQIRYLSDALSNDIDAEAIVFEYVKNLRQRELDVAWRALEDKRSNLTPIFRKAMRSSVNKYGDKSYTPLVNEIDEFLQYQFGRRGPDGDIEGLEFDFFWMVYPSAGIIDRILLWLEDGETDIPSDGIDFEYWCAEQLVKQGWTCSVTRASGDQGVDVLAVRDEFTVAIQCKRYTSPIGNKAVQEVFAGQKNVEASGACIIGTGGFTRSAKELALTTSVCLIDAQDIGNFSYAFGLEPINNGVQQTDHLVNLDPDQRCYLINFASRSERAWGNLFRNTVINLQEQVPDLGGELADIVMQGIEKNSGAGEITVSEMELMRLISYSNVILDNHIEATEGNLSALESMYPSFVAKVRDEGIESFRYVELIDPDIRKEMISDIERFMSGTMYETFPDEFDKLNLSSLEE